MRVNEIMTAAFETIEATSTLNEAAQKMKSLNIGFLPVQENRRIIGVLTDRDIVIRALAEELNPGLTPVRDILTSEVVYCYEDESVAGAARLMEEHRVRRLLVCDYDGNPVGVVSIGDLAVKSGEECLSGEVLEQISEPAAPMR
jgi:CBS domain-containing protein